MMVVYTGGTGSDSTGATTELAVVVGTAGNGLDVGDWTLGAVGTTLDSTELMACPAG
jgi:hypothetical protein